MIDQLKWQDPDLEFNVRVMQGNLVYEVDRIERKNSCDYGSYVELICFFEKRVKL